jgi:hypothetical protein
MFNFFKTPENQKKELEMKLDKVNNKIKNKNRKNRKKKVDTYLGRPKDEYGIY